MGFFDNLKDRILGYDDDDYYDDDFDDDFDDDEDESGTTGILGNTRRPEADSVSVYTRSGRPVSSTPAPAYEPERRAAYEPERRPAYDYDRSAAMPVDQQPSAVRATSSQLPPYLLSPSAYDDVQTVVRRVRTNQPVIISFKQTDIDVARRILDFCFGLSFGLNGSVEELGDRVFAVLPAGITLSQSDIDRMVVDESVAR